MPSTSRRASLGLPGADAPPVSRLRPSAGVAVSVMLESTIAHSVAAAPDAVLHCSRCASGLSAGICRRIKELQKASAIVLRRIRRIRRIRRPRAVECRGCHGGPGPQTWRYSSCAGGAAVHGAEEREVHRRRAVHLALLAVARSWSQSNLNAIRRLGARATVRIVCAAAYVVRARIRVTSQRAIASRTSRCWPFDGHRVSLNCRNGFELGYRTE